MTFRLRETKEHTFTLERNATNGMYTVKVRAGITIMVKLTFDNGRDAWRAFRSSAETLMNEA